jgi:hypothetical protein
MGTKDTHGDGLIHFCFLAQIDDIKIETVMSMKERTTNRQPFVDLLNSEIISI